MIGQINKGIRKAQLKQNKHDLKQRQKAVDRQQNPNTKQQRKCYARLERLMIKKLSQRTRRKNNGWNTQHTVIFTLATMGVFWLCATSQAGAYASNGSINYSSSFTREGYHNPISYLDAYNHSSSITPGTLQSNYHYSPTVKQPLYVPQPYEFNFKTPNRNKPISSQKNASILIISRFSRVDSKQSGVSSGGIYQNQEGTKFVMKYPQKNDQTSLVNELVASKVASTLMEKESSLAPVSIFINDKNHLMMIASKFNENYISKATLGSKFRATENGDYTLNGNIISGNSVAPVALALFLEDWDLNSGNVGVLGESSLIKMDFGNAFDPNGVNYHYARLISCMAIDYRIDFSPGKRMLTKIKAFYRAAYAVDFNDLLHSVEFVEALEKILAIPENELIEVVDETVQHYIKEIGPNEKVKPKYDKVTLDEQRKVIIRMLHANRASFQEIIKSGVCEVVPRQALLSP